MVNGIIEPLVDENPEVTIRIMWTHTTNTNIINWRPNHFVPCVTLGQIKEDGEKKQAPKKRKIESFFMSNSGKKSKVAHATITTQNTKCKENIEANTIEQNSARKLKGAASYSYVSLTMRGQKKGRSYSQ